MTTQKRRSSTSEHGAEGGVQDEMEASGGSGALARHRLDKDEGVGVEILARQELAILMEMAKPYLENVETKVVLRRLVHSLVPMHRPTVALIADPDLYGPIVLTATKALLLQAAGFSVLSGILVAIFYWVGLSGGLYLASRRILHEYRIISGGLGVDPASQKLDEEQGGAALDEGQREANHGGDDVAVNDHDDDGDKGRHVYLRPLRLDQLFCVCGYGVFSHCLLLGLTPTSGGGVFLVLCKLSVLLSSSACIALVVFRSMSVLANAQTATALGAGVIVLHGLIWPALLGLLP